MTCPEKCQDELKDMEKSKINKSTVQWGLALILTAMISISTIICVLVNISWSEEKSKVKQIRTEQLIVQGKQIGFGKDFEHLIEAIAELSKKMDTSIQAQQELKIGQDKIKDAIQRFHPEARREGG